MAVPLRADIRMKETLMIVSIHEPRVGRDTRFAWFDSNTMRNNMASQSSASL
jgi:hypothetical protein